METNHTPGTRARRRTLLPFLWWIAGVMAAGLIILSVMLAGKNRQVNDFKKALQDEETSFISEKNSLLTELSQSKNDIQSLQTRYNSLHEDLRKSQVDNSRLLRTTQSNAQTIDRVETKNALLQESLDNYSVKNEQLAAEVLILNDKLEDCRKQLNDYASAKYSQEKIISDQKVRILSDSAALAESERLRKTEDVSGYFNNTDLGGAFGLGIIDVPYSRYFYSLNTINGYVINKRFLTGVGLGINSYNGGWMTPLYLDFRYKFRETGYTPYLFADGGFLIIFDDITEPGFFLNPGLGIQKKIHNRFTLNLGTGLFIQRTPVKASFINFKLGFTIYGRKEE